MSHICCICNTYHAILLYTILHCVKSSSLLQASFQRSNSHDKVRKIVAEEGRAARNLIAWSVPLENKEEEGWWLAHRTNILGMLMCYYSAVQQVCIIIATRYGFISRLVKTNLFTLKTTGVLYRKM